MVLEIFLHEIQVTINLVGNLIIRSQSMNSSPRYVVSHALMVQLKGYHDMMRSLDSPAKQHSHPTSTRNIQRPHSFRVEISHCAYFEFMSYYRINQFSDLTQSALFGRSRRSRFVADR